MELNPKDAELIIGLVARIGVDTKAITKFMIDELRQYDYDVIEIHVTDKLKAFSHKLELVPNPPEARYASLIKACNKLREEIGVSVMADLAVMEIARTGASLGQSRIQKRRAFIVNQIKRPEEFERLRKIYGEQYIQVSCHADEDTRVQTLTAAIADAHPSAPKDTSWELEARRLVSVDESQEGSDFGQRVRQVFPLSDIIVRADNIVKSEAQIARFFRALFGDKSVTPTAEEYGMELANTAGQRSSDLSRQVGAAIMSIRCEIKALGCNEVSRPFGGTYWEGDENDARDFKLGHDSNEKRRRTVLLDLISRLGEAGGLSEIFSDSSAYEKLLFERDDKLISDSQLMDSLEYGRSVHAEMNAITDAARTGNAIGGCILFSNTFPCHNCAKHIVASGIKEVIYIHPYPKSYAQELFKDSIVINPSHVVNDRVVFRQFVGVLGPMYGRLFTKARWKRSGTAVQPFVKSTASFIRRTPLPAYLGIEQLILDRLRQRLLSTGYLKQGISESN